MLGAQEPEPHPQPIPKPVVQRPPMDGVAQAESAEAQMAMAKRIKTEARGTRGELRMQRLKNAALAFVAVAHYWPEQESLVVEAHFRRAEILRSLGEGGAARGAFEDAVQASEEGNDYGVRALLEIGHLCRRAKRHVDAIRHYRRARDSQKASLRFQNDGREWLARTYLDLFDWKAAETAAEHWEMHAENTVERIQAEDLRLRALVGRRKLHRVREELEDLRARMQELATAPTSEGEAVQRALEGMKVIRELEKARRNGR